LRCGREEACATQNAAILLMGEAETLPPVPDIVRIQVKDIEVPRNRIRKEVGAVEDLAHSLEVYGLMHPIQVYRAGARYRLIAGERRLRAAIAAGWKEIDARIHPAPDKDLLLELIENTQRKHLTDEEEADALIALVRELGYEVKEVSSRVGRSEAYVSKRIRIFEDPLLRKYIETGTIGVSFAEEFLVIAPSRRGPALSRALDEKWDVPRARRELRRQLPVLEKTTDAGKPTSRPAQTDPPNVQREFPERVPRQVPALPGATTHAGPLERPSDFARQVRALARILRDIQPSQLTSSDERALADLLRVLLTLARAHARGRRGKPIFPSIQEAERLAHRR
jgi:ParB family chromosome partitioning protein